LKEPPKHIIAIVHFVVWMFLFLVSVSIQFIDYGFENAMVRSVVNLSVICVLFYLHFYLINQFFEKRKFIIYGILVAVFTGLFTLARIFFNEELMRLPVDEIKINRTVSVWLFGIFTAIAALVVSFLYQMIKNRYKKEKQHLNIINEQNEAKIQYLKAQINPHFLFNSLNNIYSLSVVKSDQTPGMVLKLSSLLRYAIYEGEKGKVSLEKEVNQIKEFISLFAMKSEEKPNVDFRIEGDMSIFEIEPMLLIPLVENCFKHGGFESNPVAFAEIHLICNDNQIYFHTKNLINNNMQKDRVGGVGLSNIKKRLEVNYGDNYSFETKEDNGIFIVEMRLEVV
jgi:two-component system LytT family sensor kinase